MDASASKKWTLFIAVGKFQYGEKLSSRWCGLD
jgi:hypothetical protein